MKLSDLKLNPNNPRFIRDEKFEKLKADIKGFPEMLEVRGIVYDSKTMTILGGNMRYRALKDLGYQEIPDSWTDDVQKWDDEKKKKFVILDNLALGEWDWDIIANEWDDEVLEEWGMDLPSGWGKEADEDNFEIPEEVKTDIIAGDLFEFGPHRLLCGDSTKAENIEKLMNGRSAEICITDPPYSVNYKSRKESPDSTLQSYIDPSDAESLLSGFISILPCTNLIMTYADNRLHEYVRVLDQNNFETIDICVWVKQNFAFWPGARYQQKHEIIFYARKKGSKFYSNTPANQSTVFEINREVKNDIHPTQKPIELWSKLVKYHTKKDHLIYEPFSGSGTTFITAHQLGRFVYGIEMSPEFCQVILDRMKKLDPEIKITKNGIQYKGNG